MRRTPLNILEIPKRRCRCECIHISDGRVEKIALPDHRGGFLFGIGHYQCLDRCDLDPGRMGVDCDFFLGFYCVPNLRGDNRWKLKN